MLSAGVAILGIFAAIGCGAGGKPELAEDYMKSSADLGAWVKEIYTRTGGDYSKLTPEERSKYVKSFAGNEQAAKDYWDKYTRPADEMQTPNMRRG